MQRNKAMLVFAMQFQSCMQCVFSRTDCLQYELVSKWGHISFWIWGHISFWIKGLTYSAWQSRASCHWPRVSPRLNPTEKESTLRMTLEFYPLLPTNLWLWMSHQRKRLLPSRRRQREKKESSGKQKKGEWNLLLSRWFAALKKEVNWAQRRGTKSLARGGKKREK